MSPTRGRRTGGAARSQPRRGSRPVAVGLGADVERHADAVAGVVAGAAHVAPAPSRGRGTARASPVRLEAAAGEHHGPARDLSEAARPMADHRADRPAPVEQELARPLGVVNLDADGVGALVERLDEAGAAADRLDRHAAEEVVPVADLVGLAPEHQDPADALLPHPHDGGTGAADEVVREVGVGQPLGEPHDVVEVLALGIGRQLDRLGLPLRHVGDDVAADVLEALVGEAEPARGEERIAAALGLGRLLEDEHARPRLARRQRRAQRCIAPAHHHQVVLRSARGCLGHGVLQPPSARRPRRHRPNTARTRAPRTQR